MPVPALALVRLPAVHSTDPAMVGLADTDPSGDVVLVVEGDDGFDPLSGNEAFKVAPEGWAQHDRACDRCESGCVECAGTGRRLVAVWVDCPDAAAHESCSRPGCDGGPLAVMVATVRVLRVHFTPDDDPADGGPQEWWVTEHIASNGVQHIRVFDLLDERSSAPLEFAVTPRPGTDWVVVLEPVRWTGHRAEPTGFEVRVFPDGHPFRRFPDLGGLAVEVVARGNGLWSVDWRSQCWSWAENDWVYQERPSDRSTEFLAACRRPFEVAAAAAVERAAELMVVEEQRWAPRVAEVLAAERIPG